MAADGRLQRIADRLVSLSFPYFFTEVIPDPSASLARPFDFRPLRDVVVFCEDCFLRVRDPANRAPLRATTLSQWTAALSAYVQEVGPSLSRTPFKMASAIVTSSAFKKHSDCLQRLPGGGLPAAPSGSTNHIDASKDDAFTALCGVIDAIVAAAVTIKLQEGSSPASIGAAPSDANVASTRGGGAGTGRGRGGRGATSSPAQPAPVNVVQQLADSHRRWTQDNPRRIVTDLESDATALLSRQQQQPRTAAPEARKTGGGAEGALPVSATNRDLSQVDCDAVLAAMKSELQRDAGGSLMLRTDEEALRVLEALHHLKASQDQKDRLNARAGAAASSAKQPGGGRGGRGGAGSVAAANSPPSLQQRDLDALLANVAGFSADATPVTQARAAAGRGVGDNGVSALSAPQRVARALRVMHTLELRRLQDRLSDAVGEMQNLTATCKVDARLGKVGV